jgi:elongation factor Ts
MDHEKALLDQNFIMDDSKTVAQYVASKGNSSVVGFKRVSLA